MVICSHVFGFSVVLNALGLTFGQLGAVGGGRLRVQNRLGAEGAGRRDRRGAGGRANELPPVEVGSCR